MKRKLSDLYRMVRLALRFFTAKRVAWHASALTYSTLLAIVPILAVMFAVARGFGYNIYIERWFLDSFRSQPQVAEVIVGFVNSYLINTQNGIFLGVGLVIMLYTVLFLVSNVERTFNEIWQVKKSRSMFRTFTDYVAMLFLFPLVIVILSGIGVSPYIVLWALFTALYLFMPNTHVKLRYCIIPGLLAGVAMQWLQLFYIHSQMWVSRYNAIYGSFAALPLFMLWIYISWTICLFGAELCYTSQNLDYYDYEAKTSDISHRYRLIMCAILLSHMCRRFVDGGRPYTLQELRAAAELPTRIVGDLLYGMAESGLVIEISSDEKGEASRYIPAESPHIMSMGTLIDRMEASGKWSVKLDLSGIRSEKLREALECRTKYLEGMKNVLLKDFL